MSDWEESSQVGARQPDSGYDVEQVSVLLSSLSFGKALRCGLGLRCPVCGRGRIFRDWFRMQPACERCGFRIERPAGYFLGSTYINYGLTAVLVTASYVVMNFGLGWPKDRLLPGLLIFCLIFPLVFFRFARSLWLSLDCYFDRVGAAEALPRSGGKKIPQERCSKG